MTYYLICIICGLLNTNLYIIVSLLTQYYFNSHKIFVYNYLNLLLGVIGFFFNFLFIIIY